MINEARGEVRNRSMKGGGKGGEMATAEVGANVINGLGG